MSLNLELSIFGAINNLEALQPILIYVFIGQTNNSGKVTPIYAPPVSALASIQLENSQHLEHVAGFNITKIYKRFYIQTSTLTGLNRNIGTGGDYIVVNNLKYKIVELRERFVNHECLVGVESALDV